MPDPLGGTDLISLGAIWSAIMSDDEHWTDRKGVKHVIATMDPTHREHIKRYLRRHCVRLELVTSLYALSTVPNGDEVVGDEDWVETMIPQTALEWLYSTPLFHALIAADVGE